MIFLGFGVTAPAATQIAALEKDDCAYSGAVVQRVALDVEDSARLGVYVGGHVFLLSVCNGFLLYDFLQQMKLIFSESDIIT